MTRWPRCVAAAVLTIAVAIAACSKDQAPARAIEGTTTGAGMEIEFRPATDPPAAGANSFTVTVRKDGMALDDAVVNAAFSMPAMPSMNMPEMHSAATFEHAGGGQYRGTGQLSMGGTWNVKVTVTRAGQEIGTKSLSIVAR